MYVVWVFGSACVCVCVSRSLSDMCGVVWVQVSLGHVQNHSRRFVVAVCAATAHPAAGLPASSPVCQLPAAQALPGLQGLGAPHPHPAGDAHHQRHEDLQHEDGHRGHGRLQRTVAAEPVEWAALHLQPPQLPVVHVQPLVEVADDDAGGRHRVEDGVDADFHHELLQLLRVGALRLHHFADVEEGHEAGEDEGGADDQVAGQGDEDEARERPGVHAAHIAQAGQLISSHLPHREDDDCLEGRDAPRSHVEVVAVGLDSLVAPLLPCGQEPGEGEDDPPDGGGHAEVVEDEEDDGAARGLQPLLDDVQLPVLPVAGDVLGPSHRADDEGHRVDVVAHGEEDDGPLGILEAVRL